MSLWWLEPGWKQTCCGQCGQNIWDSGGDPDHGVCAPCFEEDHQYREAVMMAGTMSLERLTYQDEDTPPHPHQKGK